MKTSLQKADATKIDLKSQIFGKKLQPQKANKGRTAKVFKAGTTKVRRSPKRATTSTSRARTKVKAKAPAKARARVR